MYQDIDFSFGEEANNIIYELVSKDINEILEYKEFLLPFLPALVKKCKNEIAKEDCDIFYAVFLQILYNSVLLFFNIRKSYADFSSLMDKDALEYLQNLFGNAFEFEKDIEMFGRCMHSARFVEIFDEKSLIEYRVRINGNLLNSIDRIALTQSNMIGFVKFQIIQPNLEGLISTFLYEIRSYTSATFDSDTQLCCRVVAYLQEFVARDYRSRAHLEE